MQIDRYDTGLLGDGGGGNVEWWWDYIRAELERAHEFYAGQIENLTATTVGGDEVPVGYVCQGTIALLREGQTATDVSISPVQYADDEEPLYAAPPPPSQNGGAPFVRQYEDELVGTPCKRCQGNGEIVTDWDRYMHAHDGDVGDEAVAECPDCNGTGRVSQDGAREGKKRTFQPCPFCGCKMIRLQRDARKDTGTHRFAAYCVGCGAMPFPSKDRKVDAINAWNGRSRATTTPSPDEAVEAERERIISQIARGIEVRQPDGTTAIRAMDEDEIVAMIRSRSAGGAA